MTPDEHYQKCLDACGFSKDTHGTVIQPFYDDALQFLNGAGVPEEILQTDETVGCVVRYIIDTYNYNSGTVGLSDFFFQRLRQLMAKYDRSDSA